MMVKLLLMKIHVRNQCGLTLLSHQNDPNTPDASEAWIGFSSFQPGIPDRIVAFRWINKVNSQCPYFQRREDICYTELGLVLSTVKSTSAFEGLNRVPT